MSHAHAWENPSCDTIYKPIIKEAKSNLVNAEKGENSRPFPWGMAIGGGLGAVVGGVGFAALDGFKWNFGEMPLVFLGGLLGGLAGELTGFMTVDNQGNSQEKVQDKIQDNQDLIVRNHRALHRCRNTERSRQNAQMSAQQLKLKEIVDGGTRITIEADESPIL